MVQKNYLFVAIDRATRLIFYEVYNTKTAENAADFLEKCKQFFPFNLATVLTDNGLEFTNKFYKNKRGDATKRVHLFDEACSKHHIKHRLTPSYHPQTNGMVERANRTIKDSVIAKNHFLSPSEMAICIAHFVVFYNLEFFNCAKCYATSLLPGSPSVEAK